MNMDIDNCAVFTYHSEAKNSNIYFYGGGCYVRLTATESELILHKDHLRPCYYKTIHSNDISSITINHKGITVLLNNGDTITGSGRKTVLIDDKDIKGHGTQYDTPKVLTQIADNAFIVNYHLLVNYQDTPQWQSQHHMDGFVNRDMSLFGYENPITHAYIKKGDRVYIDYYDLVKRKLLNKPHTAPYYFRNVKELTENRKRVSK